MSTCWINTDWGPLKFQIHWNWKCKKIRRPMSFQNRDHPDFLLYRRKNFPFSCLAFLVSSSVCFEDRSTRILPGINLLELFLRSRTQLLFWHEFLYVAWNILYVWGKFLHVAWQFLYVTVSFVFNFPCFKLIFWDLSLQGLRIYYAF